MAGVETSVVPGSILTGEFFGRKPIDVDFLKVSSVGYGPQTNSIVKPGSYAIFQIGPSTAPQVYLTNEITLKIAVALTMKDGTPIPTTSTAENPFAVALCKIEFLISNNQTSF